MIYFSYFAAILQGSCKLPLKEWKRHIMELNSEVLSAGVLQQLRNALPTTEVLKKLSEVDVEKFDAMPEGEQASILYFCNS